MSGGIRAEGTLGYERALEWKEPPSPEELAWCGWSVARAVGKPAARWLPLARIGSVRLYLCPPETERDAATSFVEPLVAEKRGTPTRGGCVGVDGQVLRSSFYPAPSVPPMRPSDPGPVPFLVGARLPRRHRHSRDVRVAVIDVGFENLSVLEAFGAGRVEGPFSLSRLVVANDARAGALPAPGAPGHGTAMAGIVLHQVPRARVGLFRIAALAGAVPAYLGPTEIAVAVAAAVESWRADVVLIAISDGAWGTPRHLRDVLREASRTGRARRGAAIVCSVGDPAKNHSRAEDSAAIGADDLASQPWVIAAAACDGAGRWLRARFDYQRTGSPGTTYNRFGPSVALVASGESQVFGGVLAADDSSQAAALVAAGAASVLEQAPATNLDDLRACLFLTADAPAEIDERADSRIDAEPGLATSVCDGRDRLGHSFKVGYGRVNAAAAALAASDPIAAALLATRRCPDPPAGKSAAVRMAEAWDATWRQALAGAPRAARLAAGYARVRGRLARAAMRSPADADALAWLARHARALSEEQSEQPPDRWLAWFAAPGDHGALADRVHHAVEVLARAVEGDAVAARWLARFAAAMTAGGPGHVGAIFAEVLRRSHVADLQTSHDFSADGSGPTPSRVPPVYHPSWFAHGSRSSGCSGGGDAGGDAGGDHRWSETG